MEQELEKLDEKGFVFIGSDGMPYWCRMYGKNPWFMYWHHAQNSWVTLKQVDQTDVWLANKNALPEDQANIYHDLHNKFGVN